MVVLLLSGRFAVAQDEPSPGEVEHVEIGADTPADDVEPAPAPEPTSARRSDATAWMLVIGGVSGAHVGAGITTAARGEWTEDAVWGGVLGSGLGLATAAVLKPDDGYTTDQAALVATGSGVGAWTGHQLARTLIPSGAEGEVSRIAGAGVLGNLAGTGAAFATAADPPSARRLLSADLALLVGSQVAAGAMDLAELDVQDDRQVRSGISLAAGLGAGAASYGLSGLGVASPEPDLMVLTSVHGGWVGLWSPLLFTETPSERQLGGGVRLGLGAGYLTSLVLAPLVAPGTPSTPVQIAGVIGGNALGAGIPLAFGMDPAADPRGIVAPMLIGGVAGQLYGLGLSRSWDLDADQAAVASTLAVWTAWQSVGWGLYGAHTVGGARAAGYGLVAAGVGTTTGLAVAPLLDVSAPGAALAASAGAWGTWYGGWGGELAGLDPDARWLVTLGLGNAALLATGVGVSGREPSWRTVGLVDGFGAVGGAGGALFGVVLSPDADVVAASSLAGSTVGLALGAWQARRHVDPGALGFAAPRWLGRLPTVSAAPWTDGDGKSGVWVGMADHTL